MPIYVIKEDRGLKKVKDNRKSYFESGDILNEKANLTFELTPVDEIPKEYYKLAGKLFQTIKDETKGKVGEGVADAAFNAAFSNKTREDIEKDTKRNAFVFIIPKGLKLNMYFSMPKDWRDFGDGILKKVGFKKGVADTIAKNTYYWYKYSSDKKNIYVAFYQAPPAGYIPASYQIQMSIRCVKNTDHNSFVYESTNLKQKRMIKEANEVELDQKNALGSIFNAFEDPDLTTDLVGSELRKYVPYPQLERAFVEAFDYSDKYTRKQLIAMTEAEHNKVLTDLTSKLYDKIVSRAHNIDYGEIPKTKGDISKLSNFEEMKDTLGIIKGIIKEYRQDSKPVDDISVAISNIQARKEMFERAFRYDCELPILMYDNMVMAVVTGTTYLITSCIEFIKAPKDETFSIQLDKVAYNKSKDGLIYNSISKFNKSCESGDFDKAMEMIIDKKVRKFTGIEIGAGIVAGVIILTNIIPILRELTYMYYYNRTKISDFFAVQADLLTMNAYNLQHNDSMDVDEREEIAEKQLAIATKFRNVSNIFNIEKKRCEVNATKDIENSNKKYKLDSETNIVSDEEDNDSDSSVLF